MKKVSEISNAGAGSFASEATVDLSGLTGPQVGRVLRNELEKIRANMTPEQAYKLVTDGITRRINELDASKNEPTISISIDSPCCW